MVAWVFNDSVGACACCSPLQAMEDGLWSCQRTGAAVLVVGPETQSTEHSPAECLGNCAQHPLVTENQLAFQWASFRGQTWGELVQKEEELAEARLSVAERQREANRRAAMMLDINLGAEAAVMHRHAEKMAHVSSRLAAKKPMPCKFLYCPPGTKDVYTKHVCSDCWAWEQTDPRSKQRKTPRTCPYLHPGEPGWQKQWETDRFFRPESVIGGRDFSALRGRSGGGKRL